mmetsp:Transcript_25922/g.45706  ORF Transcript_25922/g.45706 Transcript_25922/m.45706 type:complete len:92 (-) Transcript_25922:667-942(-)
MHFHASLTYSDLLYYVSTILDVSCTLSKKRYQNVNQTNKLGQQTNTQAGNNLSKRHSHEAFRGYYPTAVHPCRQRWYRFNEAPAQEAGTRL